MHTEKKEQVTRQIFGHKGSLAGIARHVTKAANGDAAVVWEEPQAPVHYLDMLGPGMGLA